MSDHVSGHHLHEESTVETSNESGVDVQEASEEFFGEFDEREGGDTSFEGEFGERVHEGRTNVSREAVEETWEGSVE